VQSTAIHCNTLQHSHQLRNASYLQTFFLICTLCLVSVVDDMIQKTLSSKKSNVLQSVGALDRCGVLDCVAACCCMLQYVAVCCSESYAENSWYLQIRQCHHLRKRSLAVCCSVLQCVAVCCSVLQCVAVCCSVLQCSIFR